MTALPAADPVAHFLLALAVIVVVCRLLAGVARRFGQPPVVGEILGGIVLGPSVLAPLWPAGSAWLLTPTVIGSVTVVGQLGLVTFLFLLGSEARLENPRADGRVVAGIAAGSMLLPFAGGVGIAALGQPLIAGSNQHPVAFLLAFGLAMSITAMPVLARILVDMGMDTSRIGRIAMACAAIGDGTAWLALTLILALSGLAGNSGPLTTIVLVAGLVILTFVVVRPLLAWLVRRIGDRALPLVIACAAAYAACTQIIGLHAAVGAFLFGLLLPRHEALVERVRRQLYGFTEIVLLPLFFATVGLSTVITSVTGSADGWLLLAAVVLVATVTKFVGAGGGARLAGLPARESLRVGTLMNCRGVTELIVASICLQYHVVNTLGFTILVLMALLTTAMTGPLLRLIGVREPELSVAA
ncbi:cation:proton antiporter domain-containing protein [Kutzneria chonburiensis]|uniref:Cation:proton antiporter n=1 Tax=Kutzneria chonburiensis TaxID=1483604 RepID=A0ABV6MRG4_9PSEU|nr:cation:proton antiporter [Kutzneria chonburiensis]